MLQERIELVENQMQLWFVLLCLYYFLERQFAMVQPASNVKLKGKLKVVTSACDTYLNLPLCPRLDNTLAALIILF
jgi:hypothetical protein